MSEAEKGEARAQGAFAAFLEKMRDEVKGRPVAYQLNFWAELSAEMERWQNA